MLKTFIAEFQKPIVKVGVLDNAVVSSDDRSRSMADLPSREILLATASRRAAGAGFEAGPLARTTPPPLGACPQARVDRGASNVAVQPGMTSPTCGSNGSREATTKQQGSSSDCGCQSECPELRRAMSTEKEHMADTSTIVDTTERPDRSRSRRTRQETRREVGRQRRRSRRRRRPPRRGGGAAAAPAEEKTAFDVILKEIGANKIAVIKEVRAVSARARPRRSQGSR